MIGVILAAGDGVRLKNNDNNNICKPLIQVNGKKLIEFAFENLLELQIDEVYVVVGKSGDLIKQTIGDKYKELKISYVYQPDQKGLINAFLQALDVIKSDETVVLQLSDEVFIDFKSEEIKSNVETTDCDFYCGITFENDPEKIKNNYSVCVDDNFIIKGCTEKPEVITNNIKGTGFCVFKSETLQLLKDCYNSNNNFPYDLCDYINYLIEESCKGFAFCVAEKEFNVNTIENLVEVQSFLVSCT